MRFLEPAHLLDVVHEVATIHILHHKVQAVLGEDSKEQSQPLTVSWGPNGEQVIAGIYDQNHQDSMTGWVHCFPKRSICATESMQVTTGSM